MRPSPALIDNSGTKVDLIRSDLHFETYGLGVGWRMQIDDIPDIGFFSWDISEHIVYADSALADLFGTVAWSGFVTLINGFE